MTPLGWVEVEFMSTKAIEDFQEDQYGADDGQDL